MIGVLHIEIALWNTVGDLLDGSGWTTALTESEVASSGTADSFLKVSHITRTRHVHQVTVLVLHSLLNEAFNQRSNIDESFGNWLEQMCKKSPTFKFWYIIAHYDILILTFVRPHRERNGEKLTIVCNCIRDTRTIVLCVRPCELFSVAACTHQRHQGAATRDQR